MCVKGNSLGGQPCNESAPPKALFAVVDKCSLTVLTIVSPDKSDNTPLMIVIPIRTS